MGMGKKQESPQAAPSQNVVNVARPAPFVEEYLPGFLQRADVASQLPYSPYPGEQVAPLNSLHHRALSQGSQAMNTILPGVLGTLANVAGGGWASTNPFARPAGSVPLPAKGGAAPSPGGVPPSAGGASITVPGAPMSQMSSAYQTPLAPTTPLVAPSNPLNVEPGFTPTNTLASPVAEEAAAPAAIPPTAQIDPRFSYEGAVKRPISTLGAELVPDQIKMRTLGFSPFQPVPDPAKGPAYTIIPTMTGQPGIVMDAAAPMTRRQMWDILEMQDLEHQVGGDSGDQ